MTPVKQSIADGPENGDCFRACVASILDLELNDVPHFLKGKYSVPPEGWSLKFIKWLKKYDLSYLEINVGDFPDAIICLDLSDSYHLIGGDTDHWVSHKVVGKNGKEVFNPGKAELINHKNYGFFLKLL